jgi:cytoskeletal protein RodZ
MATPDTTGCDIPAFDCGEESWRDVVAEDPNGAWRQAENEGDKDPSTANYEIRLPDVVRSRGKEIEARRSGPVIVSGSSAAVLISRRTVAIFLAILLVLAIAVVALLYATLTHNNPGSAAAALRSTATQSPTPTDQGVATRPSPSLDTTTPATAPSSGSGTFSPTATPASTSAPEQAITTPSGVLPASGGPAYLGAPVEGSGTFQVGQDVQISQVDYPQSVIFYCPNSGIDWNVAGNSSFSATFGIVDGATSAVGAVDTIKFTDENGRVLKVLKTQLGQPQKITFSLKGIQRLVMTCTRVGPGNVNNVALGNAFTVQ